MIRTRRLGRFMALLVLLAPHVRPALAEEPRRTSLRFSVTIDPRLEPEARKAGRLLVVLGRPDGEEPRLTIGRTGMDAPPVLGRDVDSLVLGTPAILDDRSRIFPIESLGHLAPGIYAVQAVLHTNPDLNLPNAPGDLYSRAIRVPIDPARGGIIGLELSRRLPDEELPPDDELVKYIKIQSRLLSEFHGRPMYLRAGVILPRDHARQPERRYPLRVEIGGYAARYTVAGQKLWPGAEFRRLWMADETPRMILLRLDGMGPLGDPYQVNSANHGPYGDAITRELIPYVEKTFRGIGRGSARVLDGGSTGGWVALALQVFYPEYFNGAWAFCPDSVDFRSFELVNIYEDRNAYVNRHGFERPAARDLDGDVRYTMRHECGLENVLGRGDSWTMSGGQWGAWNATYGPRDPDGRPGPLWDPTTGAIDRSVLEHWKRYDLRRVLEENWAELGPKLRGKLHIWIGEADDYFLNNAVHRLDAFLRQARPPFEGSITYGPGQGHCWAGIPEGEMMRQMAEQVERSR
jgi:hypothetical protein